MSQKPLIHIVQPADTEGLPAFAGMPLERISMPATAVEFALAATEILQASCIGFDTESKPTFKVGELSSGPHLIQFATLEKVYLLRVGMPGCTEAVRAVLQAPGIVKIGFGLKSDHSRLRSKLNIQPASLLDLGSVLRYQGKKGQVGLRGAVAAILGTRIEKSRRVATSNWANARLTEAQQAYAANDAYAALRVFLGLALEQQSMLLRYVAASDARGSTPANRTPRPPRSDRNTAMKKTLTIRWQRLVNEHGQTCPRCGATEQAVRQATADLRQALRILGIDVRLETSQLSPADFAQAPLESNRLWIADVPLEQWLGAAAGESRCCSACGDANCRTLEVADATHEAVPAELIIKAGLLAAAQLPDDASGCCPTAQATSGHGGCCS